MTVLSTIILSTLMVFTSLASAQDFNRAPASTIKKIVVKGNRKIEESAVRNKLTTKVGDRYSVKSVREDVQSLFETRYFNNVEVDLTGGTLTYILTEKPTISEVLYKGNSELDDEEIEEAAEVKAYEILDLSKIRQALEKIEKLYEDKGFFLAKVSYILEENKEDQTVSLTFDITENDMVQVARIRFIGNKQLSTGKLQSMMETKEGGFFSFMSGSGAYKQDAFDRDVQRLNYVYFNEGFVQVKVDRPQVYVTPDKKQIYITIRVDEGERFNIGTVDYTGDLLFTIDELEDGTAVKSGELFVYENLQKDLRRLQAKYGDLGYAYANIIPRTRVREKDRLVDVTFEIDKGNKVYIGKINVKGNTKTRDKVVRREMRITEGELYNETRKRESVANIRRLGFFEEVIFNTKTPPGQPDKMDIDIVVKERNTGTIQVGAGYSSFAGFVLNGQVNQTNLFGKGQKLGVSIDYSEKQQLYNLNFTEPYFNDTEWLLGFDAYRRSRQLTDYREERTGGSVRVGHPLAPYLRGVLGYKLDDTDLELGNDDVTGDPDLFPVDTANGITSAITMSLVYDKRNDRFAPSDGLFSSVSLEYAGVGGDLSYTKGLASFRYYKKVFWEVVWRNNLNYGVITPNSSDKRPPFNQLFLLGGANSLRGFDWFTIGKRKYSQVEFDKAISAGASTEEAANDALRPFGGRQQIFYNLEFQFPMIQEAGVMGVVFYDIGYADDNIAIDELRSDVGFGFRWFSPIGPLRFEWGFPFNPKEKFNEDSVNFQFAIGSPF